MRLSESDGGEYWSGGGGGDDGSLQGGGISLLSSSPVPPSVRLRLAYVSVVKASALSGCSSLVSSLFWHHSRPWPKPVRGPSRCIPACPHRHVRTTFHRHPRLLKPSFVLYCRPRALRLLSPRLFLLAQNGNAAVYFYFYTLNETLSASTPLSPSRIPTAGLFSPPFNS